MQSTQFYRGSSAQPYEVARDEKWAEQQYNLAWEHYYRGNWTAAEHIIEEVVRLFPGDPRYRLLLAQTYSALGRLHLSQIEVELLKRIDPANPGGQSLERLLAIRIEERTRQTKKNSPGGLAGLFERLTSCFS